MKSDETVSAAPTVPDESQTEQMKPGTTPQQGAAVRQVRKAPTPLAAKVTRLRNKALFEVGGLAEDGGGRRIGHGKLILAGQNAIDALALVDEAVKTVLEQQPCDTAMVVELMRLKLDFNRQILESGRAHLSH